MTNELPTEYDLIVIGTGFPESCIAAAASRIGKSVLHIDPNEFYGGAWASFGLIGLNALLETGTTEVQNGSYKWYIQLTNHIEVDSMAMEVENAAEAAANTIDLSQSELLQQSRRFNLDLCPKILYSAGDLVKLLIKSNICRYAEFRAVDRVCTSFRGDILNVPCSRSDVFNTKELNMVEKRLLMKFLSMCMSYNEDEFKDDMIAFRGKTFSEYLNTQRVTDKISTCVLQAIAMCNPVTSFEDGMQRTKRFLNSLGRYGNTPFLFPMYGCGEIPQCFCRLCAVFGGIYCLKRRVENITIDDDTQSATVELEGKAIRAKHVVSSHGNLPHNFCHSGSGICGQGELINHLSRGIFITSTPLGNEELNVGGGGVNLMRLVSEQREAILIQLSHYSGTCPKNFYVFHITTPALSNQPEQDLAPFTSQVFDNQLSAPKLLYSAFFTLTARASSATATPAAESNVIYCTSAPYYELDYDLSIKNAYDIFTKLYDSAEFLPRAPDPEEILIEGEDPCELQEFNLDADLREQFQELEKRVEEMQIPDTH